MEKRRIQQGDCILVEVSEIPKKAKRIAFSGIVLKGEGVNTHEMTKDAVEAYELDGVMYLRVLREDKLCHQEHGNEIVHPSIYRRDIEREWDAEAEEARQTRD